MTGLAIGVDVGGTKVAAGLVSEVGEVVARRERPTPSHDAAHVVEVIREVVVSLRGDAAARSPGGGGGTELAVGIGAAGFVDAARAVVRFAPNLAWRDEPLRDRVARAVGATVVVENDANAAAWAEYRFGAGAEHPELLCLTVGTGIGAGLVLGGRLYRGAGGMAGEPGHLRVVPDGRRCGCGQRGCWEQYASGPALAAAAREAVAADPAAGRELLRRATGAPARITGPLVTAAAQDGDPLARDCLAAIGRWLGAGLAGIVAVLDPQRIVVGGGVAAAGELLLAPARCELAERLPGRGFRSPPPVVAARLGPDAGLVGAADLARLAAAGVAG